MRLRFFVFVLALVILAIGNASAQARTLRDLISWPTAAEAMADVYGRAITEEFARRLWEQGTPTCKSARNLDQTTVIRRAHEILVSYGAKLVALQAARPSEEALAAKLDELAGAGSAVEVRAFSDERRLKELQSFLRAKFNDNLVDRIANDFSHYALIHRSEEHTSELQS